MSTTSGVAVEENGFVRVDGNGSGGGNGDGGGEGFEDTAATGRLRAVDALRERGFVVVFATAGQDGAAEVVGWNERRHGL